MFARVTTDCARSNHGYAKNISKAISFLVGEPKAPFFKVQVRGSGNLIGY